MHVFMLLGKVSLANPFTDAADRQSQVQSCKLNSGKSAVVLPLRFILWRHHGHRLTRNDWQGDISKDAVYIDAERRFQELETETKKLHNESKK